MEGYVYFMYDSLSNEVKIGRSKNPWYRMQAARTFNPRILLLHTIKCEDYVKSERDYWNKFKHLHNTGEWFSYRDELKEFLDNAISETKQVPKERKTITSRERIPGTVVDFYRGLPF